jgi:hypothetical protein
VVLDGALRQPEEDFHLPPPAEGIGMTVGTTAEPAGRARGLRDLRIRSVDATELEIRTPTPGFEATIYVARSSIPKSPPPSEGWTGVSREGIVVGKQERIDLDTAGNRFSRYLVWITKLPPGEQSAKISEISLFQ